jgi:transcription factor E
MNKKDEITISLLKDVIRKIAGKNTEEVVDILYEKQNVNEFKIAEKLKRSINEVRNILYKISSFNIISSTRKKDKKKGWYTYFWTLDVEKALETLRKLKQNEIDLFEHVVKSRKTKNFYVCEADNIEMSEETALLHSFLCPECNELMQPVNEDKKVKEMVVRIENSKKELAIIQKELDAIRVISSKAASRKDKREKKKEKIKRATAREVKALERVRSNPQLKKPKLAKPAKYLKLKSKPKVKHAKKKLKSKAKKKR